MELFILWANYFYQREIIEMMNHVIRFSIDFQGNFFIDICKKLNLIITI